MKLLSFLLAGALLCAAPSFSQSTPGDFQGAEAKLADYKAIYYLNDSSTKKIQGTLRNIKNALADPRLQGKLEVELVVFGDGVEVFKKTNHYDTLLLALQQKGVVLAQCLNTMKERDIPKEALWDFISYVPTGNGEVILRQAQGWSSVHP